MGSNSPETSISQNESQIPQYEQKPAEDDIRKARAVKSSKNGIPSVDEAMYYLKIRVLGLKIDVGYDAYCAAIIREYLAKKDRVSLKTELAVLEGAMAMHYATLNEYPRCDISAARKYNDHISMSFALAENKWNYKHFEDQ